MVPCRRLLREQFKNGRLDAATSKAEILEELCDKLNFDPDSAAALHKQLYRERLTSVVADKKISGELCAAVFPSRGHSISWWRILLVLHVRRDQNLLHPHSPSSSRT